MSPEDTLADDKYYRRGMIGSVLFIRITSHTLWASSTTRTFPVSTSDLTNKRVTISKSPHAHEGSMNGSVKSTIVNCPAANRLAAWRLFGLLSRNDVSKDIRCFNPDS